MFRNSEQPEEGPPRTLFSTFHLSRCLCPVPCTLAWLPVRVERGSRSASVPLCNQRGHCLLVALNCYTLPTNPPLEQQSTVPNSDFIERRVCSHMGARTHMHVHTQTLKHPSWKVTPGYFDCFWPLCSPPNVLSACQPHTQHFSYEFTYRLGKITPQYTMSAKWGVLSSWFGHKRLEDMAYRARGCVLFIDEQVFVLRPARFIQYYFTPFKQWTAYKLWLVWNASLI